MRTGPEEPVTSALAPSPPVGHDFAGLARSSAVFALGSVTGKLVGLALLPVLTRALSPEGFGRLDVLSTLATTVTSVAVLGLDVGATRLYPDYSPAARRTLFGSWMGIASVVLLPVVLILGVGARPISRLLFGSSSEALGVAMVGVYAAGNLYQVVGLTALRNQGRAAMYALVGTGAFVVNGVAVLALVTIDASASRAMAGMAIGVSAGALAAAVLARHLVLSRPSVAGSRALLALGLPLVPALVATWVGDFANRAILLHTSGPAEVGMFSVALRFGSVGVLVVTAFQLAWLPRAFAQAGQEGAARIARDAERIVVTVTVALVPLAVFGPEMLRVIAGAGYAGALPAIGFTLVTTMGLALFTVATLPSAMSRRMGDLGMAGTFGALSAVLANLLLARPWGAAGTAAALAIGQLVATLVAVAKGRNASPLPLAWLSIARIAGAAVAVSLVCTLPTEPALGLRLAAGTAFAAMLALDGSAAELVRYVRARPR